MKNKKELKDELKNISPFLFEQKGKPEGFDVPKDYFKSLPDEVLNKLHEHQQLEVEEKENWFEQLIKSFYFYFQPRFVMAYATVALLIIAGVYFINKNYTENEYPQLSEAILDEVPDDILQAYISENIDEFDESILTAELADYSSEPLPELNTSDDDLLDELIEDMNIDDLQDFL